MVTYRYNRRATMMQGAEPGLTKLAAMLGQSMNPQAKQAAYDQGQQAQSRIALALSQIGAHDAQAREHNAKADVLGNRGDVFNEMVANAAGVDVPTVFSYRNKLDGTPDMVEQGPPTEDGEMGTTPRQFDPAMTTKLSQAMRQFMPLITNAGDINPDQMAKASGEYRNQALSDAIINGTMERNVVGGAQAAAAAKDLFKTDSTGGVLDQYTGALNTANPLAQSTIAERGAAAREKDSAVGRNQAQAQAALTTAQAHMITANRPHASHAPAGYRFTENGDLSAIPGGPADKPEKLKDIPATTLSGIITNAQNIKKVSDALALLEGQQVGAMKGDKAATGLKGYLPQTVLNAVDPSGVDTRAAITDIGSLILHDRSGANVTASESPRLMPFIPQPTDSAETVKKKLQRFLQVYQNEAGMLADVYSPANGYKQAPNLAGGQAAPAPSATPAPAAGSNVIRIPAGPGSERARLLQGEYLAQTDPANRAAVGRELQRLGIPIPQVPAAAPAAPAAPAAAGGWRIIGRE